MNADLVVGLTGAAVLVAALAGIYAFEGEPLAATLVVEPPPAAQALAEIAKCAYVEIGVDFDRARLGDRIPSNFEPVLNPAGQAQAYFGVAKCAEATIGNETGPIAFVWLDVPVRPTKDGLIREDAAVHMFRLDHYVLDDAYARAHEAIGDNHTRAEAIDATGTALAWSASLRAGGKSWTVQSAGPPIAEQIPPNDPIVYREFGLAKAGYAVIDATVVPDPMTTTYGPGTIESPPGSITADLFGERSPGLVFAGGAFGLADGKIYLMPSP